MHYPLLDLTDFCFVLFFFVVPALFSPVTGSVSVPSSQDISWTSILLYACLVIYMAFRYHISKKNNPSKETETSHKTVSFFSQKCVTIVTTFLYLAVSNYIITKLAYHFGGDDAIPSIQGSVSSTGDTVFLTGWTILLAAFEEFTYRWFLPVRLRSLFLHDRTEDEYTVTIKIICELIVACLFALAHRYMGWWAVLNAFIAGIILRSRFFITGSVYPALIAHILYNLTAFYGILKP